MKMHPPSLGRIVLFRSSTHYAVDDDSQELPAIVVAVHRDNMIDVRLFTAKMGDIPYIPDIPFNENPSAVIVGHAWRWPPKVEA